MFFKNYKNKYNLIIFLTLFHIFIISLANWAVKFQLIIFGRDSNWGMFVFPIVIVATDLTIRLSNKNIARIIISFSFIPAIIISSILDDLRIGIASGCAYFLGQLLDIIVFQKIREKFNTWWPAPLISTLISNLLDTYTFYGVAFYKSSIEFMAKNWISIANTDFIFKCLISTLVFLPLYGLFLAYILRKFKK